MKKIMMLLLASLMLCACSNKDIDGGNLADIKKRGKIVVAMEGTWAPWTYHDEDDNLVGFDVEVAKYVADYIGVEVEYVEGEWDGLLQGIEAGRYDMMVNGCGVTEERKQSYLFSDVYAYDRVAVIVRSDNEDIQTMEDLNGKKTANTISSVYATIAEEYGATVTGVDDLNQTFLLLKRGDIDATVNAEVTYGDYMKANPDEQFKIACIYPELSEIAIPMKKGSEDLCKLVNEAIAQAHSDGTLSELSIKYFGTDITRK